MKIRLAAAACVALFASNTAQASVVNFDDAAGNNSSVLFPSGGGFNGFSFSDQGLTFTNDGFFMATSHGSFYGASNGSTQLSFAGLLYGDKAVITRSGGGTFNVQSLDLGLGMNTGLASDHVVINGTNYNIGTTLTTLVLNLTNITELDISGVTPDMGYWNLDNVVFSTTVGLVPEPAQWTLFLAGFGGVGFMLRRSRRKDAVTA